MVSTNKQPEGEDRSLVIEYLELLVVLDLLQDNLDIIQSSNLRLTQVFEVHLITLMDSVTEELTQVRKSMRTRGIKIIEEGRKMGQTYAKYLCRGYTRESGILDGVMQARTEERLAQHLRIDLSKIKR